VRVHDGVSPVHQDPSAGVGTRTSRPATSPTLQVQVEDVVHLALGRDGVWQVAPYVPPYASFLSRAGLYTYSSRGVTQAIEQERGRVVDMYV
jgi:hypothetical protein